MQPSICWRDNWEPHDWSERDGRITQICSETYNVSERSQSFSDQESYDEILAFPALPLEWSSIANPRQYSKRSSVLLKHLFSMVLLA